MRAHAHIHPLNTNLSQALSQLHGIAHTDDRNGGGVMAAVSTAETLLCICLCTPFLFSTCSDGTLGTRASFSENQLICYEASMLQAQPPILLIQL